MIRQISCCGCYFDHVYFIVNCFDQLTYESFDKEFDWIFTNLTEGTIMLICDDVFSQELATIDRYLYQFNLVK